jgi:hypothetical protein
MDSNVVLSEEREELFPTLPGEDQPITSVSDVAFTLAALKSVKLHEQEFAEQERELVATYRRWYRLKAEQCQRREAFLKERLRGYLEFAQRDKLATPEGTVFYQKTRAIAWPDDDTILREWIKADAERTDRFLVIKEEESINKTELGKAIRAGEIQAPGIAVEETTEIRVRT